MAPKTKVVIFIDSFTTGGAQTQLLEFFKYADFSAFEFWLVNLDATVQTLTDQFAQYPITLVHIHHHGFLNLKTIMTLFRLLKQISPDIVQTYLFTSDTYGRLAAVLAGAPVIITSIRSLDTWKKRHHLWVDRILEKFTHKVTINAQAIRPRLKELWSINDQKIVTIYNGIDMARFHDQSQRAAIRETWQIPSKALVIGMVGKFRFEKDYESFFQAAARLHTKYPHLYFVAVGDGPKQAEIETYAKTHAAHVRAIFTGSRSDIPQVISAMDICVLATHAEGCPNALMEYMAAGKPVVSSNVGGCKELVLEGQTGFLVEDEDVDGYTYSIEQLINDPQKCQKMGEAGKKRMQSDFSTKALAQKTETLYRALLSQHAT